MSQKKAPPFDDAARGHARHFGFKLTIVSYDGRGMPLYTILDSRTGEIIVADPIDGPEVIAWMTDHYGTAREPLWKASAVIV
jgi:hypothetical protein